METPGTGETWSRRRAPGPPTRRLAAHRRTVQRAGARAKAPFRTQLEPADGGESSGALRARPARRDGSRRRAAPGRAPTRRARAAAVARPARAVLEHEADVEQQERTAARRRQVRQEADAERRVDAGRVGVRAYLRAKSMGTSKGLGQRARATRFIPDALVARARGARARDRARRSSRDRRRARPRRVQRRGHLGAAVMPGIAIWPGSMTA